MARTVAAVFDDSQQAENAAEVIREKGLRSDDISIVSKHSDESDGEEDRKDDISGGVVTGGIIGGLGGLALGMGSLVIPGLGIIAAAGPIAGILGGAVTGGIVGGLIDLGIPEDESRRYESHVKQGKVLFSMKCEAGTEDEIVKTLRECRAGEVKVH